MEAAVAFVGTNDNNNTQPGSNPAGDILGVGENDSCCPHLSWKKRMIGFLATGLISALLGGISIYFLFQNNLTNFAIFYSLGNACAIGATLFLVGPRKQFKKMIRPHRAVATAVFIISLILTIVFAFATQDQGWVIIICVIVQFAAFLWYTLSFMPFTRRILKKCFGKICPCPDDSVTKA